MRRLVRFAEVAQLAEQSSFKVQVAISRLAIRSTPGVSMHSAAARHGVGGAGCARPEAWAPCSETPHPTGCSRLGTAEVDCRCSRRSAGGVSVASAMGVVFSSHRRYPSRRSQGSKAATCKAAGVNPCLFEPDRRVESALGAEDTRRWRYLPARTRFSSVWRRWQRAWFGTTRSQVRALPPRPVRSTRTEGTNSQRADAPRQRRALIGWVADVARLLPEGRHRRADLHGWLPSRPPAS